MSLAEELLSLTVLNWFVIIMKLSIASLLLALGVSLIMGVLSAIVLLLFTALRRLLKVG